MESRVLDQVTASAIDGLTASLATLASGVEPADVPDAIELTRELEAIARRLRSVQLAVADRVERRGLHRLDGHASIKVYLRHNARLSDGEAARRAGAVRCLRGLPIVAEAYAAGRIGSCHLDRIARAFANPRTRTDLCALDANLAALASRLGYVAFDRELTAWLQLHDQDGTRDTNERNHHNRTASLLQDPDLSWRLAGHWGALEGARMRDTFDAFIAAETQLDWDKARAEHGPDATADQLPRTDGQRRADALSHLFHLATNGFADETGTPIPTTDLVIDHTTFEREATRLAGATPLGTRGGTLLDQDPEEEPDEPRQNGGAGDEPGRDAGPNDRCASTAGGDGRMRPGTEYRCHTRSGHRLEPTEAVAAALLTRIRRIVLGTDSVTIDLGRRSRLFTGAAQLAATISHHHCYWPGCHTPLPACQTDHLKPWSTGGRTNPGNGAPACGRHNRLKEHGYTIRRDEHGRLHTHRPDGTEIT